MKLITENITDVRYLVEEDKKTGKKEHFIHGIFMQAETKNKNGRLYPLNILSRETNRYNNDYVKKNRAFGELGHPDSPSINLDRVSHMITSLHQEGNNFVGKAKVLDTPNGKIVKSLLEGGACLGVSTRGVGSLKPHQGFQLVQDDYHLATAADIVSDPSGPGCFIQGIMESADWLLEGGEWKQRYAEKARKLIEATNRQNIEDLSLRIFENFIKRL